jgi:hypothetical protein
VNGADFIPPQASTLEVSLFGCGVGESLALHLGNEEWVLVDACRANRSDLPLNLAYLYSLGLDPAAVVKLFVVTHWHDDHINGAAEIVKRCPGARISFSGAVARDEFLRLVFSFTQDGYIVDREKSGVREMGRILGILSNRRQADPAYKPFVLAQADQLLHRTGNCELFAISPSPGSVEKALAEISAMWANLESGARITLVPPERNHNSIALWIRWGDRRALLGADLEQTGNQQTGWTAALQCQRFPNGKAMVFKIPHHGSPNGDSPEVWSALVGSQDSIAILTSYGRGVTPRPSENDLRRISERTSEIYCTTLPKRLCHVGRGPWSEPWPKLRSSGEQLHVRLGIFECSGQRVVSLISLLPARRLRSSKRPHSGCAPDTDTTQEMGLSQYSVRHNFGMRC